jgi:hypothetical protein
MSILSLTRDSQYKRAVDLARQTLVPVIGELDEFMDVAIRAMNACGRYARMGKLKLVHNGGFAQILMILPNQEPIAQSEINHLLDWAEPQSVMNFLAAASGIAVVMER